MEERVLTKKGQGLRGGFNSTASPRSGLMKRRALKGGGRWAMAIKGRAREAGWRGGEF